MKKFKDIKKYEFLEHTADLKIKVYGKTFKEILINSQIAISSYLSENNKVNIKKSKTIEVSGIDKESLLYNYIEEILFLVDAENFLTLKSNISLKTNKIKAELYGDNASNYILKQIKSPTYSEMEIKKTDLGWEAQFVVDI